ncbi:hypothetical protein [Methanobacterium congolense]|uniref:Putative secreted protein n=1 Tax=Methanobacterium congolense TaxID=118062 RepID=A0A1D3KZX2_9EURY|nr:hypothetical protein [Methanobacterium congolense]SCG84942.1 putative secreted protein [Methanobacterium congolense]
MKIKYLGLFAMFLILATSVQPICATHQTKIYISDHDGNYQKQYNLNYTVEKFKATLYDVSTTEVDSLGLRNLEFYVFKVTPDGHDILPYYNTKKLTNGYGTATTPDITFKSGDYILLVRYGGNNLWKLSPSNSTVKIHVN